MQHAIEKKATRATDKGFIVSGVFILFNIIYNIETAAIASGYPSTVGLLHEHNKPV